MSIKTVYRYDKTTKEYLGEAIANESQVRPGTYFIQPYTTDIAPPVTGKNEVAVFDTDTGEWGIIADYRGEVYYDTATQEKQVIQEIGITPDEAWTTIEPTDSAQVWNGAAWELPFAVLKARKSDEIAAERYATANGVLTINGHTYDIDVESRTAFIGAMALVKVQDADSMQWKTVNGFVTLSAEEFTKIVSIGLAYINTCFGAENAIWEQIDTVSTAEELDSIVWTAPDVDDVIAAIEQKQTTE